MDGGELNSSGKRDPGVTPARTLLFSLFRSVNCEMFVCQNYLFRIAPLLKDTDRLLPKRLIIKPFV